MEKKGIQIPFSIVIFLIIIIIIVALLLIWNFSGIGLFDKVFGSAGKIVEDQSGGAVSNLIQ